MRRTLEPQNALGWGRKEIVDGKVVYKQGGAARPLIITITTFGYKFGVPYDTDLLFDLRFLPNPHFVPELKPYTGEDPRVRDYVMGRADSGEFLSRLLDFLEYLLPRYRSEGKIQKE